ncbi:3'(2'),5'-bisphosphate nucleotidase CysQ [Campylobacter concisus]|uniref:3'(2'),5'-bisphosphate nucleotidase CysQ family protein n=1 Tax=Campylobacter concisus TaxID=199 RepID=UPI000B3D74D9|nr:3'(2'),5'-bisphosphate nucleotidase CysQ [Campylobacter concisus]OUT12240.1 3'(2'),5'-bisphosphate nucleotidase CysQ [Campylobacter concisus]
MSELLNLAIKAAVSAGREIMKFYSPGDDRSGLQISIKEDSSPLTSADLAANEAIIKELKKSGIDICSEESILSASSSMDGSFWLIDPLDGTKEFLARNGEFCVCIALIKKARPVLGVIFIPVSKELFYADENGAFKEILDNNGEIIKRVDLNKKDKNLDNLIFSSRRGDAKEIEFIGQSLNFEQRCIGSAIKFCRLVEFGGAYLRFAPSYLWDNAAGEALVNFCGGKVFDANSSKEMSYELANLKSPFFIALSKNTLNLKDKITQLYKQSKI